MEWVWQTHTATIWMSVTISHKDGNQSTLRPSYTTLGHIPTGHFILQQRYFPMFIVALFVISRIWKQLRYASTDEQLKKMCYICTMKYYSAVLKIKSWNAQVMNGTRKKIILREATQPGKTNIVCTHLYVNVGCYVIDKQATIHINLRSYIESMY